MDDATPERWLPVPGWEGHYEISDLGRVRSLPRIIRHGRVGMRFQPGRIMKPQGGTRKNGRQNYLFVFLCRDGKRHRVNMHIMVARAFLGAPSAGQEVCHGPGGWLDNRLVNLSYGTHAKNQGEDRRRDGTLPYGERGGCVKLTDEIVLECRARMVAGGETYTALAAEFGIGICAMRAAIIGKTWKHLPPYDDPAVIARAQEIRAARAARLPEGAPPLHLVLHRLTLNRTDRAA